MYNEFPSFALENKTKAPMHSITAKELLKMTEHTTKMRTSSQRATVSGESAGGGVPTHSGPTLGRGLAPGIDLEFDMDAPIPTHRPSKAHVQKEIAKVCVSAIVQTVTETWIGPRTN